MKGILTFKSPYAKLHLKRTVSRLKIQSSYKKQIMKLGSSFANVSKEKAFLSRCFSFQDGIKIYTFSRFLQGGFNYFNASSYVL